MKLHTFLPVFSPVPSVIVTAYVFSADSFTITGISPILISSDTVPLTVKLSFVICGTADVTVRSGATLSTMMSSVTLSLVFPHESVAFIFIDAVPSSFSETVTVPVYVPSAV